MLGILLEQPKPQDAGVEILRFLKVTDGDENMAEALQLDHG
jgi:hypothetical protein